MTRYEFWLQKYNQAYDSFKGFTDIPTATRMAEQEANEATAEEALKNRPAWSE